MKKTLVVMLVALGNLLYAGGPASAATGNLDTTFSGDGYVTIPHLPFTTDTGEAVVAQEDGKIVTVGRRANEDTGALETLALRYQEDGTPDPAFGGGDGLVSVPMGGPSQGYDVALLSDGRIVVAGEADVDPDNIDWDFAVALLTTSGDLDPNFGNGGVAIIHLGEDMDVAYGVAVDPSDRIVIVGDTWGPAHRRFGVVRLDAAGTPDATFSNDGIQRVAVGKSGPALDVAIQSDGKIVVVGQPSGRFGIARLLDDGSLDDTFSRDGTTTTSASPATYAARAVAIQPDGKIVVVGGYTDFYVARYRTNGRLDSTFGGDGLVRTNFSS